MRNLLGRKGRPSGKPQIYLVLFLSEKKKGKKKKAKEQKK